MGTYNLARTAVNAALVKIATNSKHSGWVWISKWNATNGKLSKSPSLSLPADKDGILGRKNGLPDFSGPRLLSKADAVKLALQIDALAVGSDHLNVKNSSEWRRIYQGANRHYPFMDIAGGLKTESIDTIPCHNCGMIVPMSMAQVDHHMPQAVGGEDLYTLKMARALGLTQSGPARGKGAAISGGSLGTLVLHPRARDTTYNHLLTATPGAKWTTNERGEAFFSLLANCTGALSAVQERCKNNLLNLAPLCGECNRNKSDWVRPII